MRPSEIKEIRRRLGLNGQQFSDLMGMCRRSLSRWENDRVEPGYFWSSILGALGYVLTCSTAEQAVELSERLYVAKAQHGNRAMYEVILVSFIGKMTDEGGG
jgi:transcriptional regulator with XRE-family HTH domain